MRTICVKRDTHFENTKISSEYQFNICKSRHYYGYKLMKQTVKLKYPSVVNFNDWNSKTKSYSSEINIVTSGSTFNIKIIGMRQNNGKMN